MVRILLPLLLILAAIPAVGQRPTAAVEVKSPDGRTIILKPDGTWEYKKAPPSPTPSAVPNAASETLSPNFSGDDVRTLLSQLVDLRKRLVKSEFETSGAYETRATEEKKKPILGNRTIQEQFYLVASGVEAEYNADSQTMTFFLPVEKNAFAELTRRSNSIQDKKTARDLSRVDLYSVSLGGSNDDQVFFDDTNGLTLSDKSYGQGFSAKVSLEVDEARRLKSGTKANLIVKFEEPYAVEGYRSGQFQTRLIGVQFFDPLTGTVLAKMGSAPSAVLTPLTSVTPNPLLVRAQELYNARRDEEALVELRRLVIDEPTNAEAFVLTGRIHLQRDNQEAAIAALKTAVFWNAKLIDAHILLGRIFLARGDQVEAKRYVTAALALGPSNAEALALQRQLSR
jgi:hypothetical protein